MEAVGSNMILVILDLSLGVVFIDLEQLKAAGYIFARNRVVVLEFVQNLNGLRPAILRGNDDGVINIGSAVIIHNGGSALLFNSKIARQLDKKIQTGREVNLRAFLKADCGSFYIEIKVSGKRL